jgi:hypothetical protein
MMPLTKTEVKIIRMMFMILLWLHAAQAANEARTRPEEDKTVIRI